MKFTKIPMEWIESIECNQSNLKDDFDNNEAQIHYEKHDSKGKNHQLVVEEQGQICTVCGQWSLLESRLKSIREHYKTDFHNYNLKRKLRGQPPLEEDTFEKMLETQSLSSVDGSDDDDDDVVDRDDEMEFRLNGNDRELSSRQASNSPYFGFQISTNTTDANSVVGKDISLLKTRDNGLNDKDFTLLIYKQIFVPKSKSREISASGNSTNSRDFVYRLKQLQQPNGKNWVLLMLGAGHFAAAVFDLEKEKVIENKSFHRYTTRRKQGGAQSSNDNSKGKAKSAGAALRRYNEMALKAEVKDLLMQWKNRLKTADLIFLRIPSAQQNTVFFDQSILHSKDERIRTFPFTTRRPTLTELKRCFDELLRVIVVDKDRNAEKETGLDSEVLTDVLGELDIEDKFVTERIHDNQQDIKQTNKIDGTFIDSSSESISMSKDEKESIDANLLKLIEFCEKGKVELLATHMEKNQYDVNTVIPESFGTTLLHIAAAKGQLEMVYYLLEQGANPTVSTNQRHQRPYEVSMNKSVRDVFRRFMANYPDKWDYSLTAIPSPLTDEMEQRQKEKLKEKKDRYEEKLKSMNEAQSKKQEEEEPESSSSSFSRQVHLPKISKVAQEAMRMSSEQRMRLDREKRARAAEARMKKK